MSDWNPFQGAARRLDDIDLPRIDDRIGAGRGLIVGQKRRAATPVPRRQGPLTQYHQSRNITRQKIEPAITEPSLPWCDRGLGPPHWSTRDQYPDCTKLASSHDRSQCPAGCTDTAT